MSGAPEAGASPWLAIVGLGLWIPGFPSTAAWIAGARDPEAVKPRGLALDRVNRRRASLVGRALADAAAEAMDGARADPATIATVIGSSLGEAATMIGLLEQMWRTRTPMSPAAFTMSVHNAASGLISISNGNRGFTTSLAADDDTPAAALLEAAGLVAATGRPVLVACADEVAPVDLVPDDLRFDLLAAAVVLAPDAPDAPRASDAQAARDTEGASCTSAAVARARIRIVPGARELAVLGAEPQMELPPAELSPPLALNPQAGLFDLVDAVLRGRSGRLRLDRGGGSGWRAQLEAVRAPRHADPAEDLR